MAESTAILPQNPNLDVPPELVEFYPIISSLTEAQLKILAEISSDLVSGNRRTDEELAADLGIHAKTVQYARNSPKFGTALGVIVREVVKGKTDNIVGNIIELGKGDWRADKFLLEYTGQFIQRSQQLSIHASMDGQTSPGDFQSVIDDFLIKLGAAGYPVEKLVQRYQELRAEGAF